MGLGARIGQLRHFLAIGEQSFVFSPIVKRQAIDIIDKGFRRRIFSEDQRMIVEFDMISGRYARHVGEPRDR